MLYRLFERTVSLIRFPGNMLGLLSMCYAWRPQALLFSQYGSLIRIIMVSPAGLRIVEYTQRNGLVFLRNSPELPFWSRQKVRKKKTFLLLPGQSPHIIAAGIAFWGIKTKNRSPGVGII